MAIQSVSTILNYNRLGSGADIHIMSLMLRATLIFEGAINRA